MNTKIKDLMDIPRKDLVHHKKRVMDIIYTKAPTDIDKQCQLAKTMANRIVSIDKAYGRYLVSLDLYAPHLAQIFLNRFKELTYTVKDIRRDKLLLLFSDED